MRLEIVRQVFLKELRETLRDRRSLAMMFGIPLVMYPLLTLSMANLTASTVERMSRETSRVAVINPEAAPRLLEQMDREGSGIQIVTAADPEAELAAQKLDAIIRLPADLERRAIAADPALPPGTVRLELDRSRSNAGFTEDKLERALDRYEQWIIRQRLGARGIPSSVLAPLETKTEDVATAGRRLGSRLAMVLPMMLLLTGMLGAFFPAIGTTTAERELGTLETLLVTPAGKMELLLAKTALVLLAGLTTAALNMVSMSLVLWRIMSMAGGRAGGDLSIEPLSLVLSYLAAVPTVVFFAATVMVVGLFSRNYREANAYATPVMLLSMVPALVSIGDPKATPALLVTPAVNTTLIIRDVLSGQASVGAFLLAFAASCVYAGLMLSVAARLFTTENLVNPAWEPLSMKGLRRPSRRERRLPAVDEALALFALVLLLVFYVSPAFRSWGLLPAMAGNQILIMAGSALLFAWLGRYRWVETFSWRGPTGRQMLGGALLGLGLVPWVNLLALAQNTVWPMPPAQVRSMTEAFLPSLIQYPLLTPLVVSLLAGTCEEVLFRGPILAAFVRRWPVWAAVLASSVLFAAAHLYLHGLLPITLISLVLGWVVVRTGSIFPAMLLHFTYDFAKLGISSWAVQSMGAERVLELASRPDAGFTEPFGPGWVAAALVVGAALAATGWRLCMTPEKRAPQPVAAED
jgi:sodium transport system permease protein